MAGRLDPVLGREAEVSRVLRVLARRTKSNCCLVGAPGVGKTAVVEAVAQRIAAGRVPPQLRACRELWSLDVGAMLAGTAMRGDFEERVRALLAEARAAAGELVLFVDELHLLVGAGRAEGSAVDAANLLKPLLARGEVRCLGATTSEEYRQLVLRGDAAFERRFQVLEVPEPDAAAAAEMLRGLLPRYAAHHRLDAAQEGVAEAAVELARRCVRGRSMPDKAIDVLDEACGLAAHAGAGEVRVEHVRAAAQRWSAARWRPPEASGMPALLSWLRQPWSRL
uniref:AAA+ ATPase domain-containing protein n=1 Tax=Alexandrium monilatum TaxID=311494 RepID=A0A7S4VPG4_9DINO